MGPREAAASRAAPVLPAPSTRVVVQELRDLSEVPCTFRGVGSEVRAPASAGEFRSRVVTAIRVERGTVLQSGSWVASVSGRPVIAFVTTVPFYRDLGVGDHGVDVKALEEGLQASGALATADDQFDHDTARALETINAAAGLGSIGRLLADSTWAVPPYATVTQVRVSVGDIVDEATVLAVAESSVGVWECPLPATSKISAGETLEVAGSGEGATVRAVSRAEEAAAHGFVATVEAGGHDPGAGLVVRIVESQTRGEVLTVPVGALHVSGGGASEVRPTSRAAVPVEVGVVAGGWAEIRADGLAAGDEVLLSGTSR